MGAQVIVQDLSKRYSGMHAVRGVSFDIKAGEILGLLGRNGAGKTSILECVIGLRRPDNGAVTLCGIDALAHPQRVRSLVGVQLQATALQPKITPREAIQLFGSFYPDPADTDELIERYQLREKQNASFEALSGGQQRRLTLALAFVNKPAVLFLDEPTSGLDPQSRRELHESIRRMRDENRTVLLTTHYIEEAELLCDRVAILDQGKIIACGAPQELIDASKTLPSIAFSVSRPFEVEQLRGLAGMQSVTLEGNHGSLRTSAVGPAIMTLIKLLESLNIELQDLRLRRPTLEDVFFELTGSSPGD